MKDKQALVDDSTRPGEDVTGYVRNCDVVLREGDESVFSCDEQGRWIARLDRYVVLPREEYEKLLRAHEEADEQPAGAEDGA